ncbi:hypothetical protein [Sphingobium subterraneum]|uniref:Uncharacterized protein n=1 Tax=Sphingobium subterraneum TaxID=627688 RepID=A0A841J4B3_9SPHN|nr:hypothetical protein [Sphingobium subterraneum]MBB6125172.1 hypothetical protein [Sphingobium subterraneum]
MTHKSEYRPILPPIDKYLDARDAADRLGKHIFPDDWTLDDIDQLLEGAHPSDALDRARHIEDQLRGLLKYRTVTGYFDNGEAAIRRLDTLIGEPWFDIDIQREAVRIGHNRWTQLYFDGPDLLAVIQKAAPIQSRKSHVFQWEHVVFEIWRFVVEKRGECSQAQIIKHVADWYADKHGSAPDYKELNTRAKLVLAAYRSATSGNS